MEDDKFFSPPDLSNDDQSYESKGVDQSFESKSKDALLKMQDELLRVSVKEFELKSNEVVQVKLENTFLNSQLREFERMRKDRYNTIITFLVCTCVTALGGIIATSDKVWLPLNYAPENNRYLGVGLIFLAVIFGPITFLATEIIWKILNGCKELWAKFIK
jgi:hypothetical protein